MSQSKPGNGSFLEVKGGKDDGWRQGPGVRPGCLEELMTSGSAARGKVLRAVRLAGQPRQPPCQLYCSAMKLN